jgi:predicted phosphohydrolase
MPRDPERVLVTSDLHFGLYPDGDRCTMALAEYVRSSDADVLAIAGDVADADTECFGACLDLFASFRGLRLVTPGNHDLWSSGTGSDAKYREILPAVAADCGFRMLDVAPVVAGRVGFIGNIGWYDYSFRSATLTIPLEQYERKELPGVCMWNDARFIDWDISDTAFTEKCLRKLRTAYRSIEPRVHTVVTVLHHVPFDELLYGRSTVAYEFCRAFLGSEQFGDLLLACPKVSYVFCGHRHSPETAQVDRIRAFSVGSEYRVKRLVDLNLRTGAATTHAFRPRTAAPQEARGPTGGPAAASGQGG